MTSATTDQPYPFAASRRAALTLCAVLASPGLGLFAPLCAADALKTDELNDIRQALEAVRTEMADQDKRRDRISEQIDDLGTEINATLKRRRQVTKRIKRVEQELAEQRRELLASREDLAGNATAVRALVRNVYTQGKQPELKVLLGEVDPVRMGRSLVWYRYVASARTEAIDSIRARINEINALGAAIEARERELRTLAERLDADNAYLSQRRKNKNRLVASIDRELTLKKARVASLRDSEALLLREIAIIAKREQARAAAAAKVKAAAKAKAERQREEDEKRREAQAEQRTASTSPKTRQPQGNFVPEPSGTPFAMLRGKLPFPVDGQVKARFGDTRRGDQSFSWKGILIEADEGTPVRVVADGVVAIADTRIGYGPTLFVIHDGGYISAYMHNSELLKSAGDRVRAGDVVAYVGTTELSRPGLYFLIRDAKAGYVDPLKWLKKR